MSKKLVFNSSSATTARSSAVAEYASVFRVGWVTLVVVLLGLVVFLGSGLESLFHFTPSENIKTKTLATKKCKTNPYITLTAFDETGLNEVFSSDCVESTEALLELLETLDNDQTTTAVLALGSTRVDLNTLAKVVDAFLTPRLEWRLVAERFETMKNTRSTQLFYDPAIHAPIGTNNNFAEVAKIARMQLLLKTTQSSSSSSREQEEEFLESRGMDFLLVKVLDQQPLLALSRALRPHQFPQDCQAHLDKSLGRAFVRYGSPADFLGALTVNNVNAMILALEAGVPYVEASPPFWGRVYHFEHCTKTNGMECAFLPIYGGTCLRDQLEPSMTCMSQIEMGSLNMMVLPKDGIPEEICNEAKQQMPARLLNSSTEEHHSRGPPEVFVNWCPQCGWGTKTEPASPALVANTTAVLTFSQVEKIGHQALPLVNYVHNVTKTTKTSSCALPVPNCTDGTTQTCCVDQVTIPKNLLKTETNPTSRSQEGLLKNALSSFMTRFNRASRRRIARLHQPRTEAMNARHVGWEQALAMGHCATLHIRRGDNMDRCKSGQKHFCSMNLTLSDYMGKAVPMLAQLNQSKHVFVMTDDPDVVTPDKLKPWQTQGYILEVVSGHNQYSQETYSDWDPFLESLYTAQSCRALVGHYISTVSLLVYRSMCTRWGECPISDMMQGMS